MPATLEKLKKNVHLAGIILPKKKKKKNVARNHCSSLNPSLS